MCDISKLHAPLEIISNIEVMLYGKVFLPH